MIVNIKIRMIINLKNPNKISITTSGNQIKLKGIFAQIKSDPVNHLLIRCGNNCSKIYMFKYNDEIKEASKTHDDDAVEFEGEIRIGPGVKYITLKAVTSKNKIIILCSFLIWKKKLKPVIGVTAFTDDNNLINLNKVAPQIRSPEGKIAIHLHLYYIDLLEEMASCISNMPYAFDLFISIPDANYQDTVHERFARIKKINDLSMQVVPNKGRDIGPMFYAFGDRLKRYSYIAHLQTKKSLYNKGATDGWRQYLLHGLMGSPETIKKIFNILSNKKTIIYPQTYYKVPYMAHTWLSNKKNAINWGPRFGLKNIDDCYFDFPAGSMFWCNTEAIKPILDADLKSSDFPDEGGQKDGTLAHTLERMLGAVPSALGLQHHIIADVNAKSYSSVRLDQYFLRKKSDAINFIKNKATKIIIFDIFDTLVTRPITNPDLIKEIVALKLPERESKIWLELRRRTEENARVKAGRDINIQSIYDALKAEWSEFSPKLIDLDYVMKLEIGIELSLIRPRDSVIELYTEAISSGKIILLVSDMFLPTEEIRLKLLELGINCDGNLLISGDTGLRKDTGEIYKEIIIKYKVYPEEIGIFGDNEHSDFQIPGDMGIELFHLLKPYNIARSHSRFIKLLSESNECNRLDNSLTLGLIINKEFNNAFYAKHKHRDLVPCSAYSIGYSIAGPLCVSFAQWVYSEALKIGQNKVYFLAREGKILKEVYDIWNEEPGRAITSEYCIISRNCSNVASVKFASDIHEIAKSNYLNGTLSQYIEERFGLTLNDDEWSRLEKQTGKSRNQIIKIENKNIVNVEKVLDHLHEKIINQSKSDLEGLIEYLKSINLLGREKIILVDVGYSGTIQKNLTKILTDQQLFGLYMLTTDSAPKNKNGLKCISSGCFEDNIEVKNIHKSKIFMNSFFLEKILASNDDQVIRYKLNKDGKHTAALRYRSEKEKMSTQIRNELQAGILDHTRDARKLKSESHENYQPSTKLAKDIFEQFFNNISESEYEFLKQLPLDDHYCGRGIVS